MSRLFSSPLPGRFQEGHEYPDNRDDYQQFNESETTLFCEHFGVFLSAFLIRSVLRSDEVGWGAVNAGAGIIANAYELVNT